MGALTVGTHVMTRHTVSMDDPAWNALTELAARRGINASALLRMLTMRELAAARVAGELPRQRRRGRHE